MSRVTFRGHNTDARTRDMWLEAERLSRTLDIVQGSYRTSVKASAGTHAGGGAIDARCAAFTATQKNQIIRALRTVGFAAWVRMPNEGDWMEHIHAIAIGCRDLSPAAQRQVTAYKAGRNGLLNNGPDRHASLGVPVSSTWEKYQSNLNPQIGDEMLGLKLGDKGNRVKFLQAMLKYAGHEPVGGQDGDYGPQTAKSVLAARKSVGSTAKSGNTVNFWAAAQIYRALARNN